MPSVKRLSETKVSAPPEVVTTSTVISCNLQDRNILTTCPGLRLDPSPSCKEHLLIVCMAAALNPLPTSRRSLTLWCLSLSPLLGYMHVARRQGTVASISGSVGPSSGMVDTGRCTLSSSCWLTRCVPPPAQVNEAELIRARVKHQSGLKHLKQHIMYLAVLNLRVYQRRTQPWDNAAEMGFFMSWTKEALYIADENGTCPREPQLEVI